MRMFGELLFLEPLLEMWRDLLFPLFRQVGSAAWTYESKTVARMSPMLQAPQ